MILERDKFYVYAWSRENQMLRCDHSTDKTAEKKQGFRCKDSKKGLNTRNSLLPNRTRTAVRLELWFLSDPAVWLSVTIESLFNWTGPPLICIQCCCGFHCQGGLDTGLYLYLASELFRMWNIHCVMLTVSSVFTAILTEVKQFLWQSLKDCTSDKPLTVWNARQKAHSN